MKRVIASAGLLALGAAGVSTAHAQWAAGPEKPWTVSGTLRGFYDDNINTQPNGPFKVDSLGFEVRPSASLDLESGATSFKASYTYALLYYANRQPDKIDQNHDVELALNHNFTERYSVNVRDSFVVAQEPDVLAPNSLSLFARANGSNIRNTGQVLFTGKLTPLFGVKVGYQNTFYDYSENAGNNIVLGSPSYSTLLDRIEQTGNLDTTWQIAETTLGVFGYSLEWVDMTGSGSISVPPTAPLSPRVNNNLQHSLYVGADQTLRSDLAASVRVGATYTDYYNHIPGQSGSEVSPYATVNLTYRYMQSGTLVFGFQHSLTPTDIPAQEKNGSVQVTQNQEVSSVYANVTQTLTPISPNLTATLTGQYQNSTYHGGVFDGVSDNVILLGLNLSYQFNHYLSAEVGYNYDDVISEVPGLEYNRNRVYIGVTASY